jgi:hypothetical protein
MPSDQSIVICDFKMRLHWSKARGSVMGNKGAPLNAEPLLEQQQQLTEASNKFELESQEQETS